MAAPRPSAVRRRVRLVLLAVLVALTATGCRGEEAFRLGFPKGVTPQASETFDLWVGSVIASLVVGGIVWGLIFWCVVAFRRRGDDLPAQVRYNLPVEILYTVVPFLIVAVLFYYTAIVETDIDKLSDKPDVRVGIIAFKWNWQFNYIDENGSDNTPVTTEGSTEEIPVLVLPTGKKIQFVENSEDVIHSFWVPKFLFKRDVIPGRTNTFELTVDKPGSYVGRCTEYCGTYHWNMNFEVRAVGDDDYRQFLDAKRGGKSTAEALEAIGQNPDATTTHPFPPDRDAQAASVGR